MVEETRTPVLIEVTLETATEEQLARHLQDLGVRRDVLREELEGLERSIEELEVELARRGAGG
jgi:polyhydroxyalkanoate synthesis regulator phasin